jgi:hypothetical protein
MRRHYHADNDGSNNNNNNNNNAIPWRPRSFWFFRKRDVFFGLLLVMVPLTLLVIQRSMTNAAVVLSTSSLSDSLFSMNDGEGYALQQQQHIQTSSSSSSSSSSQLNPTLVLSSPSSSSSSSSTSSYWSLVDPTWPQEPPTLLPDCKVIFRKDNNSNNNNNNNLLPQRLCHIVPWGANFGDELGPPIVKRILELYFHCSAQDLPTLNLAKLSAKHMNRSSAPNGTGSGPCLFSVGSLWRMAHTNDHLWGTGVAFDGTVQHRCMRDPNYGISNLTIYASRGPNSVAQIHQYCPFAALNNNNNNSTSKMTMIPSAGDAGFLVPYLFPEYVPRDMWPPETRRTTSSNTTSSGRGRLCIIPHHDERNNPQFKIAERDHGAQRLTVQQSWQNMTTNMLTMCDRVLSSSLHGIIFAETLGLPSKRFRLTQMPGNFKFDDFYASYRGGIADHDRVDGIATTTTTTTTTTRMDHLYARNLTTALNDWIQPLSIQQRDAYARRILKTFPIHLFETETVVPVVEVTSATS